MGHFQRKLPTTGLLDSQQDFIPLGAISLSTSSSLRCGCVFRGVKQSIVRWRSYANRRRFPVILVHPFCLFKASKVRIPNQRDASWRAELSRGARGPNRK